MYFWINIKISNWKVGTFKTVFNTILFIVIVRNNKNQQLFL